jgi:hypothetical protein
VKNKDIATRVKKRMVKNPPGVSYTSHRINAPKGDSINKDEWNRWYLDLFEWGKRVRRDILVIEEHLKDQRKLTDDDFYGDPGDPPPDPIE